MRPDDVLLVSVVALLAACVGCSLVIPKCAEIEAAEGFLVSAAHAVEVGLFDDMTAAERRAVDDAYRDLSARREKLVRIDRSCGTNATAALRRFDQVYQRERWQRRP